jgi:hypothetical protein
MKKKKKKEQLWGTVSSDKDGRKKKKFQRLAELHRLPEQI